MAKFDAGLAVEALEYDFKAYGGSAGTIPEPSTKHVNTFFDVMRGLIKESRALQKQAEESKVHLEEMDGEEISGALDEMDETFSSSTDFQTRTIEAVADLCQNTPSAEDLGRLPYRVLAQFNKWLISEITPKSETPESGQPQRPPLPGGGSRKRKQRATT